MARIGVIDLIFGLNPNCKTRKYSAMRSYRIGLTLLYCIVSLAASGQEWLKSYQKAQELYTNDQLEDAYAQATFALENFRKESGEANTNYASLLRLTSTICFALETYDQGLLYSLDEIRIREAKKDPLLASAYSNTALFYRELANYTASIEYFRKSTELLHTFYTPDQKEVLLEELNLATTYYLADQNQEAHVIFENVQRLLKEEDEETLNAWYYFAMLKKEMGLVADAIALLLETKKKYESAQLESSQEYAFLLSGLADAYHHDLQYTQGEENYQSAQQLFEELGLADTQLYFDLLKGRAVNLEALQKTDEAAQLLALLKKKPAGRHAYANALTNSAALNQINGQLDKAEQLYLESLDIYDPANREGKLGYAEAAERLALLYSERGKHDLAAKHLAESNEYFHEVYHVDHPRLAESFNKWGIILVQQNKLAEARTNFQKALTLVAPSTDRPRVESIIALTGLAQCAQKEAAYRKADSLYRTALSFYDTKKLAPDAQLTALLTNYAASAQEQGQLNVALRLVERAATEQRKKTSPKEREQYALLLEDLALLNLRLGNRQRAKGELDSAFLFFNTEEKQRSKEYASLLLSRGRYHQLMGEFPQAESFLRQGADLTKKNFGEASVDYALAINALALLYQTMGNYSEAEPLFRSALAIRERQQGKLNTEYSTVLQNLASLYQLQDLVDKAEPLLQESIDIDRQVLGAAHPQYAISLQNLATLYQKKKKFTEAVALIEQIKTLIEKTWGPRHPSYATVISNLATLYQDLGRYDQSEKLWKESVELRRQLLGEEHPDFARSLYGLAGVQFATGQWQEAQQNFSQVVGNYQNQINAYFHALSEKEKGAFYSRIKPIFETYQDFCVQMIAQKKNVPEMLERLFDLQLSTKAILLSSSNKVRTAIQSSGDKELQDLFHEWQSTKEMLVRYYGYSREERTQMNIDLKAIEVQSNDLEKKLSEKSAAFGGQVNSRKISWRDVQQNLKPDEAAIEIIRIRKKFATDSIYYTALIIAKGDTQPRLLVWPYGDRMESRIFRFHRNAIKFHQQDTISHRYFWQPLAQALPTAQTLYISCDGVFNKINFNSIQDPSTKKWVVDDYSIRLLSNTREITETHLSENRSSSVASTFGYADFNLKETDKATANSTRATRFGFEGAEIPMLPATEKEVNLLNEVLKEKNWTVNSYTLDQATEANMKRIVHPQILHIATHGFFLSDVDMDDRLQAEGESELTQNPLFRSGILLAGAALKQEPGQEDGVLTAYEAMNLNLDHTELVSLSACETGVGEVRNGEGVYGLQRAFLVAGARTVIMSLWQVDDVATQELMSSFYKAWLGGVDKFQAFRQAQMEIKAKYNEPFYWGAFVIIGN